MSNIGGLNVLLSNRIPWSRMSTAYRATRSKRRTSRIVGATMYGFELNVCVTWSDVSSMIEPQTCPRFSLDRRALQVRQIRQVLPSEQTGKVSLESWTCQANGMDFGLASNPERRRDDCTTGRGVQTYLGSLRASAMCTDVTNIICPFFSSFLKNCGAAADLTNPMSSR